jgi:hypothetical protein
MAELDGNDDLIQIVLPSWCNDVTAMSVLWIDSWLVVMNVGQVIVSEHCTALFACATI